MADSADTQSALGQTTPGIIRDYEMEDVNGAVAKAAGCALRRRNKTQPGAPSSGFCLQGNADLRGVNYGWGDTPLDSPGEL